MPGGITWVSGTCCCSGGTGQCLSGCNIPLTLHMTFAINKPPGCFVNFSGCVPLTNYSSVYTFVQTQAAPFTPIWSVVQPSGDAMFFGQFVCNEPLSGQPQAQGPWLQFNLSCPGSGTWAGFAGSVGGGNPWESGASCSPAYWAASGFLSTNQGFCNSGPYIFNVVITA